MSINDGFLGNIKVGVGLMVFKGNKTLLTKRKSDLGKGRWGSIGGKLEFLEMPLDCVKREASEELGVKVVGKPELLAVSNIVSPGDHWLDITFKGEIGGEPKIQEEEKEKLEETGFYNMSDLPGELFVPVRKGIEAYRLGRKFFDVRVGKEHVVGRVKPEKDRATVGVNVLIEREGKLLMGKRKGVAGEGSWGLPGGRLEFGEKIFDCAKRELMEEVGLKAKDLEFLNIFNQIRTNKNQHWIQVGLVGKGIKGEPKLMEPERCFEWRWFENNKLPKNIFRPHKAHVDMVCGKGKVYVEERFSL